MSNSENFRNPDYENPDIREIFPKEEKHFNPWLASEGGLKVLGDAIGHDLVLKHMEKRIGPFEADIVAEIADSAEEAPVVIEVQLGKSNHDHLGKVLTYAASLKAKVIVFVATEFTEEHRQALDWLNENTNEEREFYGLEIFPQRIDKGKTHISLKTISRPNQLRTILQKKARGELSVTKQKQMQFWEELQENNLKKHKKLRFQSPRPKHWNSMTLGKAGVHMSVTYVLQDPRIGCELYLSGEQAKSNFDQLMTKKEQIEKEVGSALSWERLDDKGKIASRIALYKKVNNLDEPNERQEALDWLGTTASRFAEVFIPLVKLLKAEASL